MRATMLTMVPATEVATLQRRIADLEEDNAQIQKEKNQVQRQLVSTTTALREELAQKRGEIMKLHEALLRKDGELQESLRRYREETVRRETSSQQIQQQQHVASSSGVATRTGVDLSQSPPAAWQENVGSSGVEAPPPLVIAERSHRHEEGLERRVGVLTNEVKAQRERAEEAEKAQNSLQEKMKMLQQEQDAMAQLLEETQQRFAEKAHALDMAQSDLAATRTMLRVKRDANSAVEGKNGVAAQLESVRAEYLNEKKTNIDLLMRVSRAEQQLSKLKKDAATKTRDINELEQLLLEETETSERYYIRLRYSQDVLSILSSFLRRSLSVRGKRMAAAKGKIESSEGSHAGDSINLAGGSWEQAVWDCARGEAYSRALLEQERLNAMLELLGQKEVFYELSSGAAKDELMTLRALAAEAAEEPQRLRRKVESLELLVEKAAEERLNMQVTIQNSESARDRLSRQVEELTTQLEQLQQNNNALIEKIVEEQSSRNMIGTCSVVNGGGSTSQEDELQETEDVGKQQIQQQLQRRLEKQVAQYQEELGLLHAQLEKERHDNVERRRLMQREKDEFTQELRRVRSECKASIKESAQIVRDYETRIKELQETITTLHSALEEECNNADKAKDEMFRAGMEKRETLEELSRVIASRDALEMSRNEDERRFNTLRSQVQELQLAYYKLEQQLAGMKMHTPDVYITIDRHSGIDDGDNSWLLKAQREKEVLEQQKQSVQRINNELLATVRQRNESLRAVHRQITKIQRGGVSPDMAEMTIGDDDSPLGAQLKFE
ncbi:kinesin, putative [Trypanosoma cruzi marinkellei]|uniref:Kinesin, putative n=1 Tax=Trypanosoma cruzi marinkellei TaxID=85056 RepID=K2NP86_TRYCR|nr:kinesin, putative [Trypanosoma cruzi marinkellei]